MRVFALLLLALSTIGCADRAKDGRGLWQPYMTEYGKNPNGEVLYFGIGRFDDREACVRTTHYEIRNPKVVLDLPNLPESKWGEPIGCFYMRSDNKYLMFAINYWYNRDAFECVAQVKYPQDPENRFGIVLRGRPHETDAYFCVLPK